MTTKQPGFHSALTVTNVKSLIPITLDLETSRYDEWSNLFKNQAVVHGVLEHIIPPTEAVELERYTALKYADLSLWKRLDAVILQWIYATVSPNILSSILVTNDTAASIWNRVHQIFQNNQKRRSISRRDHQDGCEDNIPLEKLSEWEVRIHKLIKDYEADDHSGKSWTIHRVPSNLLSIFKKAFIPKIISIGPFHFGHGGLQMMEEYKERYLCRLLKGRLCNNGTIGSQEDDDKSSGGGNCISWDKLKEEMSSLVEKARKSYSEEFNISKEDFVKMMIVDGCFVVELLRLYHKFDSQENIDDPIFKTRWMLRTLQRDMVMLENQLPFFVLEKIFELTSSSSPSSSSSRVDDDVPSLAELVLVFFDPLLPREGLTLLPKEKKEDEEEYAHILDMFLWTFLQSLKDKRNPPKWNPSDRNVPLVEVKQLIHGAAELQDARVNFKKKENLDLLDIKFKDGILEIPTVNIDDNSVPVFLNFLAYEQCNHKAKPFFTCYFNFLDSLINSQKDVEILHQSGIVNHVVGSDKDCANIFHVVCREIVTDLDDCYLSQEMKDINEFWNGYNEKTLYFWWTKLMRDNFSSPWTTLSFLAAILLLILTIVQTVYTVLPYYHPPSNSRD